MESEDREYAISRELAGPSCLIQAPLRIGRMRPHEPLRLGFFTEIYRPAVNGVVASVDTFAQGLRSRGHEVYCFAPSMPGGTQSDGASVPFTLFTAA